LAGANQFAEQLLVAVEGSGGVLHIAVVGFPYETIEVRHDAIGETDNLP
jgi:hypothetical protein